MTNFEEAVRPLIKYLAENHNPHVTVIVTSNGAELLLGETIFNTDDYIKD